MVREQKLGVHWPTPKSHGMKYFGQERVEELLVQLRSQLPPTPPPAHPAPLVIDTPSKSFYGMSIQRPALPPTPPPAEPAPWLPGSDREGSPNWVSCPPMPAPVLPPPDLPPSIEKEAPSMMEPPAHEADVGDKENNCHYSNFDLYAEDSFFADEIFSPKTPPAKDLFKDCSPNNGVNFSTSITPSVPTSPPATMPTTPPPSTPAPTLPPGLDDAVMQPSCDPPAHAVGDCNSTSPCSLGNLRSPCALKEPMRVQPSTYLYRPFQLEAIAEEIRKSEMLNKQFDNFSVIPAVY